VLVTGPAKTYDSAGAKQIRGQSSCKCIARKEFFFSWTSLENGPPPKIRLDCCCRYRLLIFFLCRGTPGTRVWTCRKLTFYPKNGILVMSIPNAMTARPPITNKPIPTPPRAFTGVRGARLDPYSTPSTCSQSSSLLILWSLYTSCTRDASRRRRNTRRRRKWRRRKETPKHSEGEEEKVL